MGTCTKCSIPFMQHFVHVPICFIPGIYSSSADQHPHEVVVHDVNHQYHEQHHSDGLDGHGDLLVDGPVQDALDEEEDQAAAVDGGYGQKVHDA